LNAKNRWKRFTSIEGGIEIKEEEKELGLEEGLYLKKEDIQLPVNKYQIQWVDDPKNIYKRESGFEIEGGLYERKIRVFPEELSSKENYDKIVVSALDEVCRGFFLEVAKDWLNKGLVEAEAFERVKKTLESTEESETEKLQKVKKTLLEEAEKALEMKEFQEFKKELEEFAEELKKKSKEIFAQNRLLTQTIPTISVLGTRQTMELINIGDILAMPDRKVFKSVRPFALLLRDSREKLKITESIFLELGQQEHEVSVYHRLGLVELGIVDRERGLLELRKPEKIIISNQVSSRTNLLESFHQENSTSSEENIELSQVQNSDDWQSIHSDFTLQLIQTWQDLSFTYQQTQEWANAFGNSFNPQEHEFINWLANTKNYSAEQTLNQVNLEDLKQEYQTSQQQTQILQPTTPPFNPNN